MKSAAKAVLAPAWLSLLMALVPAACARQPGTPRPGLALAPGDHAIEIEHDGRNRYFLLHVPPTASAGEPLPLVLAMHGGGGNPEDFKEEAGLDAVADREGALVAYPAGSGVLPRTLLTWNSGTRCCGFALDRGIDDVGSSREQLVGPGPRSSSRPRRSGRSSPSIGSREAPGRASTRTRARAQTR